MHRSSHAALALLLLSAQPAPAQAPLPPGFTDAAAVVDGLIVDMRYFGANNFVGERIDGYERPRRAHGTASGPQRASTFGARAGRADDSATS